MSKTNNFPDPNGRPDKLLADLSRVVRMLREQGQPERADAPMTAIVRLVPGLNLPNWQKLSGQGLDKDWIALDLNEDLNAELPAQKNDSGRDNQTGMWQFDPFLVALDLAMQDSRQNGLTLSLILFQVDNLELKSKTASIVLRTISSQIWESTSERDQPGHLAPNQFALALPGCSPFQAKAMAENIIVQSGKDLQRQGLTGHAVRAGIASQPRRSRQPASANDLLGKARQLLEQTGRGQNLELKQLIQMEKDSAVEQAMETLVLADEKHFLFTGGI